MQTEDTVSNRFNRRGFLQIVAVAGAAAACWRLGLFGSTKSIQVARRSQPIMGTVLNLTVYGPNRDNCEEALQQTIATMKKLESKLSRHMPGSELSRLNRTSVLLEPGEDLLRNCKIITWPFAINMLLLLHGY